MQVNVIIKNLIHSLEALGRNIVETRYRWISIKKTYSVMYKDFYV